MILMEKLKAMGAGKLQYPPHIVDHVIDHISNHNCRNPGFCLIQFAVQMYARA